MGELIHMRPDGRLLRGRSVDRSAIAVIRNHLKKANFHSFDNLLHAFKFYDKVHFLFRLAFCDVQQEQGIHRHQTPPRYRNAASGSRLKGQPATHRHTARYG